MRPPRAASPAVTLAGGPPPVLAGNRAPTLSIWTLHCAARRAGTAVPVRRPQSPVPVAAGALWLSRVWCATCHSQDV